MSNCGAGLWHRVAFLDMSDSFQQCPSSLSLYNITGGVIACGRPGSSSESCPAVSYTTNRRYSKVCGRVIGYQYGSPDAFSSYDPNLNETYMDGISITHIHGTQCTHIWSYVAGISEIAYTHSNCPCTFSYAFGPQSFVGSSYYCESGNPNVGFDHQWYSSDLLWDGQQCEGICCTGTNTPPWFSVQLPAPTTDAIEVRNCGNEGTDNENISIKLLEIFVQ